MGQVHSDEAPLDELQTDLKRLMVDERFYDIILKCSDGRNVFGCKAILASRSEFFDKLIFTGSANKNLSFDNINSNSMKVVLEYLYTSAVGKKNLTVDNIVEVYHASVHFDLMNFNLYILGRMSKLLMSGGEDIGKKLLSDFVDKFSFTVENEMSYLLVQWVAKDKLNKSEVDSLSLNGLKYLLSKTLDDDKICFATSEFDIWEYTLAKAERLVKAEKESKESKESNLTTHEQGIQKYLTPFVDFINISRMDAREIKLFVEPYDIFPINKVKDVYGSLAMDKGMGFIRGVPIFRWKKRTYEPDLKVSKGGFTVEAVGKLKSILGDLKFKSRGDYEWNILIEKLCEKIYVGICGVNENINQADERYGWVLGSDGYVHCGDKRKWYDAKFKEGDKITVHLNMHNTGKTTCFFSINEVRKNTISGWNYWDNIPSQVYPIATLGHGSKLRIEQPFNYD